MKLNQVIAVEKSVKTKVQQALDIVYKVIQKPQLFEGFSKTYRPLLEDEVPQPPQSQKVQLRVESVLLETRNKLGELFDVVAQKDFSNCSAKANIVVGDEVIAEGVPSTYLLFLEKQLTDLHTLIGKLPTLDPSEEWTYDSVKGMFKTEPTQTQRTRKVSKPLVLYPATEQHPAQTQVLTEDIPVGVWDQTKLSGATTEGVRRAFLARIEQLSKAVKFAREHANLADAPPQTAGQKVLDWVFAWKE